MNGTGERPAAREASRLVGRRVVASVLIAPVFLLTIAGCERPIEVDDGIYLEELYHFKVENGLQFGSAIDENGVEQPLLLDLFQPTDDPSIARPGVIWVHGGSFVMGTRGEMTEFARRFATRGYVSATIDYRLREGGGFDYTDTEDPLAEIVKREAQHDILAAVRWLRANASGLRLRPDRIFVVGYSAGGTAGLRAAAYPEDPGESGTPGESSDMSATAAISGFLDSGVLEATAAPTLLIHGEADTKVPFPQIEAACSSVSRCTLVGIPEAPHNLLQMAKEDIIRQVSIFLEQRVRGG